MKSILHQIIKKSQLSELGVAIENVLITHQKKIAYYNISTFFDVKTSLYTAIIILHFQD